MSSRSDLIKLADALPQGSPERKELLTKLAAGYHGDPNVALESVISNATGKFLEDVAYAVLRYGTLKTSMQGKGGTHSRRGSAYAYVVDRSGPEERGFGVEAKMAGSKIQVTISDLEERRSKTWKFPSHDTPSSIGSMVSWYATQLLTGE